MEATTLDGVIGTDAETQPAQTSSLNPDMILDLIDQSIEAGEDPWEIITDAGIVAAADMDIYRWFIGDLACRIEKKYGENRIGEFAKTIHAPVDRVEEYRTVCRFYKKSARAEISGVPYTIWREAMKLMHPLDFLRRASALEYTVERARIHIAKVLGKPVSTSKLVDQATCRIVGGTPKARQIIFEFDDSTVVDKLNAMYLKGEGLDLLMDIVRWVRK